MDLSVAGLIESIKLDGTLPDGMFENSDLTKFLNDGFYGHVLSFIMKHREDYFLTYTDYTYANSIPIPKQAIGAKLNDVVVVNSEGEILRNLPRVERDSQNKAITHEGFYIEGNNVKFHPKDTITEKIRLYYYKRPEYLASPDDTIPALAIYDSGIVGSDKIPSWVVQNTFAHKFYVYDISGDTCYLSFAEGTITPNNSESYIAVGNIIKNVGDLPAPMFFRITELLSDPDNGLIQVRTESLTGGTLSADVGYNSELLKPVSGAYTTQDQPYTTSDFSFVVTEAVSFEILPLDVTLSLNDYVVNVGYRAIADMPFECREVLLQAAVLKAMISIKDKDGVKLAGESLQIAKDNASDILTPRVDNEVKRIVPRRGIWSY